MPLSINTNRLDDSSEVIFEQQSAALETGV